MSVLFPGLCCLLAVQGPVLLPPSVGGFRTPAGEAAEAVPASPSAGLRELVQRSAAEDLEGVEELAAELLARTGRGALDESWRAEVHYALGVARHRAGELEPAADVFLSARGQAGPGELRRVSTYNAGCMHLERAEEHYARIPEVAQAAGAQGPGAAPALPPGPGQLPPGPGQLPPGGPGADQAEPIELAREAYLEAQGVLVERLRLEWRDPDTRANLEWIQRRLRELDEIERQREEQQQEQQDQPQEGEPDPDQESEADPDQEGDPGEQEPQEQDPEQDPESEPQEEPPPDEPNEEPQEPPSNPEPAEAQEGALSDEEASMLLDRLKELEAEARELMEALRRSRQVPVERDW